MALYVRYRDDFDAVSSVMVVGLPFFFYKYLLSIHLFDSVAI